MSSNGLSLVGFMPEQQAVHYLGNVCVPADGSQPALSTEWAAACTRRGAAVANPGEAVVDDIPSPDHDAHLQAAATLPWIAPFLAAGWAFKQADIDLLLAFQHHVDLARSDALCAGLPPDASLADALPLCIPLTPSAPPFVIAGDPNHGLVIKTPSSDLRIVLKGQMPNAVNVFGIQIGWAPPFVQILRCNGRCYLTNGFHRTFGLRRRGLLRVPCLFRDVADFNEIGAPGGEASFDRPLLESADPPTFGHFANERAYDVKLRKASRVIHMNWSDYFVPEE